MTTHPVAELFPMMTPAELNEMAESIKKEGLLQSCVRQGDVLLDGRNRIEACRIAGVQPRFVEYEGDSPVAFIISVNLSRRHLEKGQKIALALEIEPHFAAEAKKRQEASQLRGRDESGEPIFGGGKSTTTEKAKARDQAAAVVGISGKLVSDAKAIKEADPELFEDIKQGKTSINKAKKEIKAQKDKADLAEAQKNITEEKRQSIESVCDLRVCSCADLFKSGIKPDAVITDPPYPEEFLPLFSELAEGCKLANVPLVAVMSGQSYLPDVMARLCEHLAYRWTLAYMTPGASCRVWPRNVDCQWKPVLLFGSSDRYVFDVFKSESGDKRFHGWGQSESGMADLVDRLTKPNQLVCDPFLGGGTTAVVSLALGRRFVGCDIEPAHVEQSRARVTTCTP